MPLAKPKMSFDFDLTAPFVPEFTTNGQMEHRHKVFPIQLIGAHSSNPNSFRLNESALSAVFGHREIANKKVF